MEADWHTAHPSAAKGAFRPADVSQCRTLLLAAWGALGATVMINLLALTGPLYALEIYDRILPAQSGPTLIAFTLLALALHAALAALDYLRAQLIARAGRQLAQHLDERDRPRVLALAQKGSPAQLMDLGWTPIYAALAFALHPALGSAIVIAGLSLALTTALLDRRRHRLMGHLESTTPPSPEAMREAIRLSSAERDAAAHLETADAAHALTAAAKFIRLVAQSGVLGLSAFLAMDGLVSMGTIMAMSVIMARTLAPIDTVVTSWPSLQWALRTYRTQSQTLPQDLARHTLHPPPARPHERGLIVENIDIGLPALLSFKLEPGGALGVVGPSGSGKSRLIETLAGVNRAESGNLRLHGARVTSLTQAARERSVGYLSQNPTFRPGTVADIISRFDPEPCAEALRQASHRARLDTLISHLPNAFQTAINPAHISPGLRQRLALARAIYGTPDLILLDEPFTHMDHDGDQAVLETVADLRAEGRLVVVVAHRLSALEPVNLVLALSPGLKPIFGPKEKVIRSAQRSAVPSRRDAS